MCVCVHVCVSTLRSHDRDSGSAVIPGAEMRLAGADRSGGVHVGQSSVWALPCVCACSAEEDTRVLPPKRHNR